MKYFTKTTIAIAMLGALSSGLMACSKSNGNSSSNVQGNVSISGSTVSSTDTVNGVSVAASISSVTMSGINSGYGAYNTYPYNTSAYSTSGAASFVLTVNGASQPESAANINSSNYSIGTLGNSQVFATSEMIDATDVALVVWIAPYTGSYYSSSCVEYKQMGMIQNVSTGAVRAVIESVGYESGCATSPILPTGAALIATLQSIMI